MTIQNVVFDIGNVFLRWAPEEFLTSCFPGKNAVQIWAIIKPTWDDLNRGRMTLPDALDRFGALTGLPVTGFQCFHDKITGTAKLLPDMIALQKQLSDAGIPLYCISDNVREVMAYYVENFDFMRLFKGVISSDDIGVLKPDPKMYQALFDRYNLAPHTCVFFDDLDQNVQGAKDMGMSAFVFTDAQICASNLRQSGVVF